MLPVKLIFSIFLFISFATSKVLYEKRFEQSDILFEWIDLYYMPLGINFYHSKESPVIDYKSERQIIREALKGFYQPRSLTMEASAYPMALSAVALRSFWIEGYEFINREALAYPVDSLTVHEYREPYAFSLLVGRVLTFSDQRGKDSLVGRVYSGYLLTAGKHHVRNSQFINSDWLEAELKLSGDYKNSKRQWQYRYRMGFRVNEVPVIRNKLFFSVKRSQVDVLEKNWSWINNTHTLIYTHFDPEPLSLSGIGLEWGKTFPLKKKDKAWSLKLGLHYQALSPYSDEAADEFSWSILPNYIF